MNGNSHHRIPFLHRRHFLSTTFKIAALGSVLIPFTEACKGKDSGKTVPGPGTKTGTGDKEKRPPKKQRTKWSRETLVINNKTNVLHFPTSRLYTYYDEIKGPHLQPVALAAWAAQLGGEVHFHKQQSGNILEILCLRELQAGINDASLSSAAETLARAFSSDCDNAKGLNLNSTNFRIHELMLQLVSLNNSIHAAEKWAYFSSRVKKPAQLRKRQQWMESETRFMERVNYILNQKNEYLSRLNQRAGKYIFT